ncbi:MAG: class I SAM-dependent methyltransferase [Ochrobactrum anthropi]|uniref:Class I SAM-dependent methyltransferase n=1 Tax=Brucella anthropi TaxID=529 RepID=A0A8I0TC96_BRUAN|nr:class I SAM-dependent methyltransferase [Brucella anthropi]MBE0564315.1 class I SAM-dependent methyltransferase [Brucella anthropi]
MTSFTTTGIPSILQKVPAELQPMIALASDEELAHAKRVREDFFTEGGAGAYMNDIIRAFRVAKGCQIYIEVGSRDKGNVAWVSTLADDRAHLIDIDIEPNIPAEKKLLKFIKRTQKYTSILGDSVGESTIAGLSETLDGKLADLIFLDSSHMYSHMMREIDLYLPYLKPGGFLLIHDILWEGNEWGKGKAQAALMIDRVLPIYSVVMDLPVHRFMLWETKLMDLWGGVGVIVKPISGI